jgi:hypothetical protein
MNLDTVITQLKAYCPYFSGNISGSADYATGLETVVSLPLPACFVYPLDDAPSDNENMGWGLRQLVQEKIAVVIEIDNTSDRRGQTSVTSVEQAKYAIFAAILNWSPFPLTRANQGLRYGGGHLIGFDRARLFWEFIFVSDSTITEDDGFTVAGQPLTEVNISVTPTNASPDLSLPNTDDVSVEVNILLDS